MTDDLPWAAFEAANPVSRETLERLKIYAALLEKWNKTINLVAGSTVDQIWSRHFLESAAAFQAVDRPGDHWVDLGTGGGFPGAVVAILTQDTAPDMRVTCIEADIRKASFLRTLSRECGVPFGIMSRRIEEVPTQNADVVSARAVAPLEKLLGYCEQHLSPTGTAVFLKGRKWEEEAAKALERWRFTLEKKPSPTDPDAAILLVGDIARA